MTGIMSQQERKLNQKALFSSETSDYRRPEEADPGDRVVVRFRTAKDGVDAVFYVEEGKKLEARMVKAFSDELFDYYEYVVVMGEKTVLIILKWC